MGPGSAAQRFAKSYAQRCVRGTELQTALPARDRAGDLSRDVALRAAETAQVRRGDLHIDAVAAAAGDAEPAVGAALQRHDRLGSRLAGKPCAAIHQRKIA